MIITTHASTLEYHRTCSLHNSLNCHAHPKQITMVFVIHRKPGHLRSHRHTGGATRWANRCLWSGHDTRHVHLHHTCKHMLTANIWQNGIQKLRKGTKPILLTSPTHTSPSQTHLRPSLHTLYPSSHTPLPLPPHSSTPPTTLLNPSHYTPLPPSTHPFPLRALQVAFGRVSHFAPWNINPCMAFSCS